MWVQDKSYIDIFIAPFTNNCFCLRGLLRFKSQHDPQIKQRDTLSPCGDSLHLCFFFCLTYVQTVESELRWCVTQSYVCVEEGLNLGQKIKSVASGYLLRGHLESFLLAWWMQLSLWYKLHTQFQTTCDLLCPLSLVLPTYHLHYLNPFNSRAPLIMSSLQFCAPEWRQIAW